MSATKSSFAIVTGCPPPNFPPAGRAPSSRTKRSAFAARSAPSAALPRPSPWRPWSSRSGRCLSEQQGTWGGGAPPPTPPTPPRRGGEKGGGGSVEGEGGGGGGPPPPPPPPPAKRGGGKSPPPPPRRP